MKPESIEENYRRKKREARRGVIFYALLLLACGVCLGALCLPLLLPALWALRQRYREIEGGEEIEARKY